ncbi:hypothetical protein GCM10023085_27700 [Actinomadura viridis]|uniref:Lipoprotein n=1 Tax=Actinomadura viridis TaxID=58110 RepID=A0A931GPB8_9ACTN|nr:hypothetical protein [Actinomadura viridis]MBG6087244.1 hypothetical protein [Actinomadura viridis]
MNIGHRAVLAAALAALLAGCSALPGAEEESDGGRGGSGGDAVAAGRPSVDGAAKAVVSGTFDTPLVTGGKVDIAMMGLRARGRLAMLTVRLTPRLPAGFSDQDPSPYRLNGSNSLGTALIDPVNLKRYVVVKDSSGRELQSNDISTQIVNNQPAVLTYTFAAPPENVKAVDVQYGSWPTFRNIPVER